MNDGAKQGDFFGTGEVDIGSYQDKLWDKQGDFLGQAKLILSHNKMNYGTNPGDFWDRRS